MFTMARHCAKCFVVIQSFIYSIIKGQTLFLYMGYTNEKKQIISLLSWSVQISDKQHINRS